MMNSLLKLRRGCRLNIIIINYCYYDFDYKYFNMLLCIDNNTIHKNLFKEIARRIKGTYGEERAHEFLLQRVAVAVQRGNAASVLGALHY